MALNQYSITLGYTLLKVVNKSQKADLKKPNLNGG